MTGRPCSECGHPPGEHTYRTCTLCALEEARGTRSVDAICRAFVDEVADSGLVRQEARRRPDHIGTRSTKGRRAKEPSWVGPLHWAFAASVGFLGAVLHFATLPLTGLLAGAFFAVAALSLGGGLFLGVRYAGDFVRSFQNDKPAG